MTVRLISKKEFPEIKELKKKFKVFRAIDIKNSDKMEAVEFFNKDGVFRGFGKDTKKAFKKLKKLSKTTINKILITFILSLIPITHI